MAYTVKWHPRTQEFLRKCDAAVSSRIVKKVDSIRDDPLIYVNYYANLKMSKLRVGDWRIFMDIDPKNKVIEVLLIDHRSRIYKGL